MPDTPSITINKQMTYRGQPEITSNTYHFSGPTPSSEAEWTTFAAAIFNLERPLQPSSIKYAGYLGYEAGNEYAVAIRDFIEEGATLTTGSAAGGGEASPGDTAAWVRWSTPDRTSRGKRIYLRKYFHEIPHADDVVTAAWRTSAMTYATAMMDGTLPGSRKICGPQGAVASNPAVSAFMTTRTLKRRGKRPSR